MEGQSLLVLNSSSVERAGGWLLVVVTCAPSVSIILVPGSNCLFGSWLISGEWAGEFRIPAKYFWLPRSVLLITHLLFYPNIWLLSGSVLKFWA